MNSYVNKVGRQVTWELTIKNKISSRCFHLNLVKNGKFKNKYLDRELSMFSKYLNSCDPDPLKVVTSEKIGGSKVTSTLGTWYGGVVMGVLLSFNEAAILYRDFNSAPSQ